MKLKANEKIIWIIQLGANSAKPVYLGRAIA